MAINLKQNNLEKNENTENINNSENGDNSEFSETEDSEDFNENENNTLNEEFSAIQENIVNSENFQFRKRRNAFVMNDEQSKNFLNSLLMN